MNRTITKKDMILDVALTLFSDRGYDGVGVDEIGDAVGMKGPALYYYFKGKDAILEGIVETTEDYYYAQFGNVDNIEHFPDTLEEMIEISMKRLQFSIHDPHIKKVRRLFMMEQFRNSRIADLATKHNITGLVELNTVYMKKLIEFGAVKEYDPEILAFEFVAPVTLLIQQLDREPEREAEIMESISRHMQHFMEVYGVKQTS